MVDAAVARKNCLLAALPPATLQRWLPHLDEQVLRLGAQVHGSAAARRYVHFPTTALVSMLHVMHDGASAEIAVIGNDGVVGMLLLMGGDASSTFGVVQGGGRACRLPLELLAGEFARGGEVMQLLLHYTHALISQMAQTVACNRHHHIEQQLCRWLLLSLDRTGGHELLMTQELIANMLGVRREGVAQAAGRLQRKGIIHYMRGHITVLDRAALEANSCECYAVLNEQLARTQVPRILH